MKTTIEKKNLLGCHVVSIFYLIFCLFILLGFRKKEWVLVGMWMETINLSLSLCDTKEV
jgi:hypothetical protein